ncbi:MAG: orotidine-5'-phosphate decarboxylase, partial [Chloroflexales bacterium]|nr:orotidine-5'-phosphate decarboxylase [Chloroflexales bacterium]
MTTPLPLTPRQRVLVALDAPSLDTALYLVEALRPHVGGFKVGLELCTAAGAPHVAEAVAAAGGAL